MKSIRPLAVTQSFVLNGDREAILARRERLDKLIAEIRTNRPWWAHRPPWEIEHLLERGSTTRSQGVLPFDEGGDR